MKVKPIVGKRLKTQQRRRNKKRTHCLWRNQGESLDAVEERFRAMVEEGSADENDDYMIFQWQW
jgi:hypothetical protein